MRRVAEGKTQTMMNQKRWSTCRAEKQDGLMHRRRRDLSVEWHVRAMRAASCRSRRNAIDDVADGECGGDSAHSERDVNDMDALVMYCEALGLRAAMWHLHQQRSEQAATLVPLLVAGVYRVETFVAMF